MLPSTLRSHGTSSYAVDGVFLARSPIRALSVPEIEALSLTKLHTSGGRRNM